MNYKVTYKTITGPKTVRVMMDDKYVNVQKYGFLVNYKFEGSSHIKVKNSGLSFGTEQEAKKEMDFFINSLNPKPETNENDDDVRLLSPEEVHDAFAQYRKMNGLPPYDPNKPRNFQSHFSNAGGFRK